MAKKTQTPKSQPVNLAHSVKTTQTVPLDAHYDIVTSLKLKRSKLTSDLTTKGSVWMTDEMFRDVSTIGIRLGVTFDEVIKGLISREMAGLDPGKGLENFIPVLIK